jgi:hypothetical protein
VIHEENFPENYCRIVTHTIFMDLSFFLHKSMAFYVLPSSDLNSVWKCSKGMIDSWLFICEVVYMDVVFKSSTFVSFFNIPCMLAYQVLLENGLYKVNQSFCFLSFSK